MDYYFDKPKESVEKPTPVVDNRVEVTANALQHLNEARKWSKFIAVFCLALAVLLVLSALVFLFGGISSAIPEAGMIGIIYLMGAVLTFVPMWFLLRFSKAAKHAVTNNSSRDLEEAFKYQKMYYIATGVMVIISIIFMVAFMIAGFTMGFVSSMMQSQNV